MDSQSQGRQDGPRLGTVEWQERGRGAPQRASVRCADGRRPMCMIAQRCRADVQRRRLGRTRTTGFRPLGERMAANRHGMRSRGRSERPLGRHGASRLHVLKIWRASECNAPWWAHRESAALAAWVATLVAAAIGRAGRATDSAPTHAQARAQAHSGALGRTHRQHSSSNQAALTSNHEQSVALGRPTPSPHAVVLGEGAAAATATDCLASFTRPPFASPRAS